MAFFVFFEIMLLMKSEDRNNDRIIIKKMETDEEIKGKAYVHWKAWQDAYAGIVDPAYLEALTLEKCEQIALRFRENTLVAKTGNKVLGFVAYGPCRDEDMPEAGEVSAIYLLKEYYGQGIGYRLMQEALRLLDGHPSIVVWVLKDNERAIRFYQKCGFVADGKEKTLKLGSEVKEMRMIMDRNAIDPLIAYCGVDCFVCPDYQKQKCPGCRQSQWLDGDCCLPVTCCKEKGIGCCGECESFPCDVMKDFYMESKSHEEAYERMRKIKR